MARPRSEKAGTVHMVKLFLSEELKSLASTHAGGPMNVTRWTIGILSELLNGGKQRRADLRYSRDPGTGPASLSIELPAELVNTMKRDGLKISATVRRAFQVAIDAHANA